MARRIGETAHEELIRLKLERILPDANPVAYDLEIQLLEKELTQRANRRVFRGFHRMPVRMQ